MRLDEQIAADIATLTRIDTRRLLAQIADGRDGNPAAQRYDTPRTSGHTSVLDEHHVPMPAVSDPTGELAVKLATRHDQARLDLAAARRAARLLAEARRTLERIHHSWMPHTPNGLQQRQTEAANQPGCRSCTRIGKWEPIFRGDVCRWCYDWTRKTGATPTVDKLRDHHDGKRVTVPA